MKVEKSDRQPGLEAGQSMFLLAVYFDQVTCFGFSILICKMKGLGWMTFKHLYSNNIFACHMRKASGNTYVLGNVCSFLNDILGECFEIKEKYLVS